MSADGARNEVIGFGYRLSQPVPLGFLEKIRKEKMDTFINFTKNHIADLYAMMPMTYFQLSPKEFGQRYIGSSVQRKRAIMRKRGLLKKH